MSFTFGTTTTEADKTAAYLSGLQTKYATNQATRDEEQAAIDAASTKKTNEATDAQTDAEKLTAQYEALKTQTKINNYNTTGGTDKDKEEEMSDYEKAVRTGDYELANTLKAWDSASGYKQTEAAQTYDAQQKQLETQTGSNQAINTQNTDTEKALQAATIAQENKLRTDDNNRAVSGYKMSF